MKAKRESCRAAREMRSEQPVRMPALQKGGSNSVVESQPSKLLVAGSIPVSRSILDVR